MGILQRYREGYNWKPYTPYNVSVWQIRWQGIHNALGLHYPSRDGSWCFGYNYVCGGCGMNVSPWSREKLHQVTETINKLPEEKRQNAAASTTHKPGSATGD